jgi:protein-S-isoprenylcysteine O-methyltransferase Ste14
MEDGRDVLPRGVVSVLVGLTWVLVGLFWAVVLHWEKTDMTEARRLELEEQEGSARPTIGIRAWRVIVNAVLVGVPLVFAIDGLVYRLGVLYRPALTFTAGPDLVLQIVGIVSSVLGLAILIGVGRKLAVNVYRLAAHERRLMATGVHRYVRHPFYIHFFLIPVGSVLVSLNYLALLLLVAYTMQWEPKLLTSWMREEEEDLRRRHGAEAEAYLRRTGRVLPRLRRG